MIRASRRISVITVTWRRSAVSCGATGAGVIVAGSGLPFSSAVAQQLTPMTERRDGNLFEVLIGQNAER
jgi:hypothetical protein